MESSPPPPAKKPKMSSASGSDEDPESAAAAAPRRRPKRRKVAIFIAYCGAGYQGMQKNPGAKTIEGDLEEALFLAGAVPEPDRGNPRRYDWARAARTDKGVSAAGQVVSGRFYIDPPGLIDRLNAHLAAPIRAFGFARVTSSFNAKKFCDRRRYIYLLPVFALDRTAHPDREAVLASLGSDNELAKCSECSLRGRKLPGLPLQDPPSDPRSDKAFQFGDEERSRFNRILGGYVGTHNFHNFTTRTKAEDPAARRFIVSFAAGPVVRIKDTEFIRCEVVGQSFMLHQIRKMIGLAVAVMRNLAAESVMQTALRKDVNINVPTAPEVGLYLDECFFTSYNQKWKDSHEAVAMEGYVEQAEAFKEQFIFPHIADMEEKEGAVALWLHSLNLRNYPDLG
ncbi:uncharacterized protein LOC144716836 isoform X2 [Wolffia australiana]